MTLPFFLHIIYGKSFEEFFPTKEIGFECRQKKTLSEPSWTAQKVI